MAESVGIPWKKGRTIAEILSYLEAACCFKEVRPLALLLHRSSVIF